MSDNNIIFPVLSEKSMKLLKRLDDAVKVHNICLPSSSFVQKVENIQYKNQITWVVKRSDLEETKRGKCIKSPYVYVNSLDIRKLWLEIFPEASAAVSYVDLHVCFYNLPKDVCVSCNVFLFNNNREMIWEEAFFGNSDELKENKVEFRKHLGLDRRNDPNEKLIIECKIKLASKAYTCTSEKREYTLKEAPKMNNYMENFLNNGKYSDVTLEVGSSSLKSHRCILALDSPALRILFKLNYDDRVLLRNAKYTSIKDMVNYIYTGNIQIFDFRHAWDLYTVAHKFEILSLKDLCSAYLNASLTEKNISHVFDLSRTHDDKYLLKACLAFIKKHDLDISTKLFMDYKDLSIK